MKILIQFAFAAALFAACHTSKTTQTSARDWLVDGGFLVLDDGSVTEFTGRGTATAAEAVAA